MDRRAVRTRNASRHLLDVDVYWNHFEGALLTMAEKMDSGVALPIAFVELISESASALLALAPLQSENGLSETDDSYRARALIREHKDYDGLCERIETKSTRAAHPNEIDLVESASPASAKTKPLAETCRDLLPDFQLTDSSTPTRNAHRSWELVPITPSPTSR